METIMDVMRRLSNEGYHGQVRAEPAGVRFIDDNEVVDPDCVTVDEVIRIEGTSSPDEETAVLALTRGSDGHKATYCVTYGTHMDPMDVDLLQKLTLH
jgi:hypothetical protein